MRLLLFEPEHALVNQSYDARRAETTTHGDGFGLGWYGASDTPALYRSILPAWNDANLLELADNIMSGHFLAHVRATTGPEIQQTNCHPFRHGRWLFMHNGRIEGFDRIRRELTLQIDPELFPEIRGSTDSELMFYLALSLGLDEDPVAAMQRMVGVVEKAGRRQGMEDVIQMTVAVSNGDSIWAFRYATHGTPRSLYHSTEMQALYALLPQLEAVFAPDCRVVVSEPLSDLDEAWEEIAPSSVVTVHEGNVETAPFVPERPQ
jgi:glutamine amidotransferase